MVGNFYELGPFLLHRHHNKTQLHLTPNTNSWNRQFGLLFIDNPIGTGFSIASSPDQIPTNQSTVAQHLWVGIQQFLDTSPGWFRARPLFLTGESYAGKYVPAAGAYVVRENEGVGEGRRINLKGVAIGNGLVHPVVQVESHAKMAFYAGLVNAAQRRRLEELQKVAVELTVAEKWAEATAERTRVLNWLQKATGPGTLYDLRRKTPYETEIVGEFLKNEEVKAALGVSKEVVWEECSHIVGKSLHTDVMKSVKPMVDELLEKTRVLLYQGMFDMRDGVASTEMWLEELKWEELDEFLAAQRKMCKVDGVHAGYVQKWKSLTQVVVDGAGHLVPTDQGRTSQATIEGWVLQNGLFGNDDNMEAGHSLRTS